MFWASVCVNVSSSKLYVYYDRAHLNEVQSRASFLLAEPKLVRCVSFVLCQKNQRKPVVTEVVANTSGHATTLFHSAVLCLWQQDMD